MNFFLLLKEKKKEKKKGLLNVQLISKNVAKGHKQNLEINLEENEKIYIFSSKVKEFVHEFADIGEIVGFTV